MGHPLKWLAAISLFIPGNALAQVYADSCRDVLEIAGRSSEQILADDQLDLVAFSDLSRSSAASKTTGVGGSVGLYKANYDELSAKAEAASQSNYQRLTTRQFVDATISKGYQPAIEAWSKCERERRGPYATLKVLDDNHLQLILSFDQPNNMPPEAILQGELQVVGATATSASNCLKSGYVIKDGCLINLYREDVKKAVIASGNTDRFGPISAYVPPAVRFKFLRMPYPGVSPGRGSPAYTGPGRPPLGATVIISPNGADKGTSDKFSFTVVMNEQLAEDGWVFSKASANVQDRGRQGGCSNLKINQIAATQISGDLTVATTHGSVSFACDVTVEPELIKLVQAN